VIVIDSTTVAGFVIPSSDPIFLAVVAVHILAGLTCVIAGAIAMFATKGRGRHSRAGTVYYRALSVVVVTMAGLALARWADDAHLFFLGCASFAAAFLARRSIRGQGTWRIRLHVASMASSYVLLLVAFYVDNGKQLPLWRDLPHFAYWLIPVAIGTPLILRALTTHPRVRAERSREAVTRAE
jgi:hypothetical protein